MIRADARKRRFTGSKAVCFTVCPRRVVFSRQNSDSRKAVCAHVFESRCKNQPMEFLLTAALRERCAFGEVAQMFRLRCGSCNPKLLGNAHQRIRGKIEVRDVNIGILANPMTPNCSAPRTNTPLNGAGCADLPGDCNCRTMTLSRYPESNLVRTHAVAGQSKFETACACCRRIRLCLTRI